MGSHDDQKRQDKGCIEIRRKDLQTLCLVFHIGQDLPPIIINMQNKCHEKEKSHIDVNVSPFGLAETPEPPICPVGDSPMWNNVKNDAGKHHEDKGKPCCKGNDFSQFRKKTVRFRKE